MHTSASTFLFTTITVISVITVYFFLRVVLSKRSGPRQGDQQWTRIGLVLAMAGNAVGFGNFLRFPVQAIQNGGGAFIIPYLACFLFMGIPLLLVEWSIGRYGGRFGNHSTPFMLDKLGKRRIWKYIGVFGLFSNVGIASYYCYMESWTLAYTFHSATGTFRNMDPGQVENFFIRYINLETVGHIPFEALVFFITCIMLNVYILASGLKGIEKVAKIGMPLLITFGLILAFKAITIKAGSHGAIHSGTTGLEFLWTPSYASIWSPKVWLAAAGQIFFTLSVGMGSIQCYASYLNARDDIALNSMSAGWMNEFVEVVIGAAIIIPIAVGYFGIDKMRELAGLGGLSLGFKTIPFLFNQMGPFFSVAAGIMWFLLLFFAGITSSVAMGKPCISFVQDEFGWSIKKASVYFGIVIFLLGLPTVLFFKFGVFDEYDYWTGTVALFIFAMMEVILFAWVFGMDKGWQEITRHADVKISIVFKYVLKYITPIILVLVFTGALISPVNDDWRGAVDQLVRGEGWPFDNHSIIKQLSNAEIREQIRTAATPGEKEFLEQKLLLVSFAKALLLLVFAGLMAMVKIAAKRRKEHGEAGSTN